MRKIFALALLFCFAAAGTALANEATLSGKTFIYNLPEGYTAVSEDGDSASRQIISGLLDIDDLETIMLENTSAGSENRLGEPLSISLSANPDMLDCSQDEYGFLVGLMYMGLSMGGDGLNERIVPGELTELEAANLSDIVIVGDESVPTLFSFTFQLAAEDGAPSEQFGMLTFLYNGSCIMLMQIGNAQNVDQYNAFIQKASANLGILDPQPK